VATTIYTLQQQSNHVLRYLQAVTKNKGPDIQQLNFRQPNTQSRRKDFHAAL
jgi:hypothetical protein